MAPLEPPRPSYSQTHLQYSRGVCRHAAIPANALLFALYFPAGLARSPFLSSTGQAHDGYLWFERSVLLVAYQKPCRASLGTTTFESMMAKYSPLLGEAICSFLFLIITTVHFNLY